MANLFPAILTWLMLLAGNISAAAQTPFQQLTQKFESGAVFHARFMHGYKDAYTNEQETKSGEIWVAEKKYKVESKNQRVAVDGTLSRVYDSQRNRLIISTYDPQNDDFAPSRILNGIDSTYTIKSQQKKDDHFIIKLDSDDPFALFKSVTITLNSEHIPTKIFVIDTADNRITTTFSDGKFIKKNHAMFTLSYPDDAKVIDMRE